MIALQNELSAESNRRDIGKTFQVLIEGRSKRSAEQLYGRTEQNKVVVFDRKDHRIGELANIHITDSSSATLKGIDAWDVWKMPERLNSKENDRKTKVSRRKSLILQEVWRHIP